MDIAVDFDGTTVEHQYPYLGDDVPDAVRVLKLLVRNDHRIVLNTMRDGLHLRAAVEWYQARGIPLYGVNCNPNQLGTGLSRAKVLADLYIDDRGLGVPLTHPVDAPPFVDWKGVEAILRSTGVIQ